MDFEVRYRDGAARAGILRLPHGEVETPAFMPVGTQGAVKCVTPAQLLECGVSMVTLGISSSWGMGKATCAG